MAHLSRLLPTLLVLALVAFASGAARAQGFMVQPMIMSVPAKAGESIEVPLQIRNTAGSEIGVIELGLLDLSQNLNGSWRVIESDSDEDASRLRSSLSWTSLSQTRVEIAPLEPAEVAVRLDVPANARGAYFAAVIAETPVPEDASGIVVRVRFLIPIIIEIQGRTVRQQVELDDVSMTYHDGSDGQPPTTSAALRLANTGLTYSRVRGKLSVERKSEEQWRAVTRFEIDEKSIIPGMSLELGRDLERRLPSGTYRLRGELYVDGRRVTPIERDIEFAGDPTSDALAYDTALILEPELVEMQVAPGASRTTIVRIENPGVAPIRVNIASSTPRALAGFAMGELNGADLSAEPWTAIRPSEFTIGPGRKQNVRVISRVPREGVNHPNYYADLTLRGSYLDGQSAGETRSTVRLINTSIDSAPNGRVEQISLAEGDAPSKMIMQMRFANIGDVHLNPAARLFVLTPQGQQVRNQAFTGEEGPLLPLGRRTYSSELATAGLEPGYYAVRAVVNLADGHDITKQQVLLVEEGSGEQGEEGGLHATLLDQATIEQVDRVGSSPQVEPESTDDAGEEPNTDVRGAIGTSSDSHQLACGTICTEANKPVSVGGRL